MSEDEDRTDNEEFRLLLHRALEADDHTATVTLNRYLLSKCKPKVKRLRLADQDDAVQELLIAAYRAGDVVLARHIEKPRNYVVRAISRAYLDVIEKQARRRLEVLHDFTQEDPPTGERPSSQGGFSASEADIRLQLRNYRLRAGSDGEKKMWEALTVAYSTAGTLTEACDLLDYTAREKDTALRAFRRARGKTASQLHAFLGDVGVNAAQKTEGLDRNQDATGDTTSEDPKGDAG